MKFDVTFFPTKDIQTDVDLVKRVEQAGLDGVWTAEVAHNPFFPLMLASQETQNISLGTQIAVAFARSPMVMAQIAWDLATQSKGRFILGMGTQVRAHIVGRFGMNWEAPIPRMREYIESLHAIWDTFQTNKPLRYKGEHYQFLLMTPFFNPGPIDYPKIPIYIAGVNANISQLAGELCEGLHAHAFHTVPYLNEVVMKNVEYGLNVADRERREFELVVPIFVVTGRDQAEMDKAIQETKTRISFYASTPSYKGVMELHGWDDIRTKLSQMAREGKWEAMWTEITDEMIDEIAIVGAPEELADKMKSRYNGLADRICLGWETDNPENRDLWQTIVESLKA